MIEKYLHGRRIHIIEDFIKYCRDNGIHKQCTVSHTPQKNGVDERKNETLVEFARSMIKVRVIFLIFFGLKQ
jgi:hypothetical protein